MNETKNKFFVEVFKFSLVAIFIVLPFRIFIAKPFIVSGESMIPTFESGDYLIVDQISYRIEQPKRGDVIVFKYPKDTTRYFIKRIIGLPGETIAVHSNKITIKNKDFPNGFQLSEDYIKIPTNEDILYTLPENKYYVMGDNRTNSSDSRIWGPVEKNLITGRAFIRLLPISQIGLLPGDFNYLK